MLVYVVGTQIVTVNYGPQQTSPPPYDVPCIEKVHDAYVIAVEDGTRKKLDQFTSDQQVHAVDMTQVPSATAIISSSNSETSLDRTGQGLQQTKQADYQQQQQQQSNKQGYDILDQDGCQHQSACGRTGTTDVDITATNNLESSVMGELPVSESSNNENFKHDNNDNHNNDDHSSLDNSFDCDNIDDPGPHREMAIDVPENFVAKIKSPPRYPPPQVTSTRPTSVTSSKSTSRIEAGANSVIKDSNIVTENTCRQQEGNYQPAMQELECLHRHEEELKKRREEQNRLHLEHEFLRVSLRGSKILQSLENHRPAATGPRLAGFVNTAFDDEGDRDDKLHSRTQPTDRNNEPQLNKILDVKDLLSSLHHIQKELTGVEEQNYITFVRLLFQKTPFQQAVRLHNQLMMLNSISPPTKPVMDDTDELHSQLSHYTSNTTYNTQLQELLSLLNKPHLKNLLGTYGRISNQAQLLSNQMLDQKEPHDCQLDENRVKVIHLEKTNEHLGATVKNEGDSVVIARIVKGGAAEKSGLLHEGDEILEVNGVDMRGRNINDVSDMLANMSGIITFMIVPGKCPTSDCTGTTRSHKVMHLRALFSYDPEDDLYIPCRELGISFIKGDILHATVLDDPNWWQAFREGEEENQLLAGLIPSKCFTEQRESLKNALENKENRKKSRVCACGRKERKKRKKKKSAYTSSSEDVDEILTYEEIARYYPQPNMKRPIVLVGPPNVGQNELQQKLVQSDPDRFSVPVPLKYTTCPAQGSEPEKLEYHHIPREEFNMMIQQNRFVEVGEHGKHLYGMSFDAIREVIAQGRVCLIIIQPQTLKLIRVADIKPYVVFVCPPNLDKLRQLQNQLTSSPLVDGIKKGREVLTIDDQLRDIIDCSREMEDTYGHLFDFVLVNSDLDAAYTELLEEINRIQLDPQWVPASWISD